MLQEGELEAFRSQNERPKTTQAAASPIHYPADCNDH